jgi:hypothetical protein
MSARPGAAPAAVLPLLADGALRLEADPALLPLLERWLPLLPYDEPSRPRGGTPARLRAVRGAADASILAEARPPTLRLGQAEAWIEGASLRLRGSAGCTGRGKLDAPSVVLTVPETLAEGEAEAAGWDLYSMATVTAALLLGGMHRALVHAAAVVAPDGGAWLLVGDARAGKTSTCAGLLAAGWRYVSDDHVVLARPRGRPAVEGWPRRFHLDEGWGRGSPLGSRGDVDPRERWPGAWVRTAPLAGLLFPRVEADAPTALAPLSPADALPKLLRQSPWLLADRAAAPGVLALLQEAVARRSYALRLGLDTWNQPSILAERLAPLLDQGNL